MPKKFILMSAIALAACDTPPLTQEETNIAVAHSVGVQACFQRGWVSNPSVMATYLTAVQSNISARGDQSLISQAERQMSSMAIKMEDCRYLEMTAFQYAQQQAENRRQQQAFKQSMDDLSQSTQQMQSQNQPRTVSCNHVQWGNMTSCTAY